MTEHILKILRFAVFAAVPALCAHPTFAEYKVPESIVRIAVLETEETFNISSEKDFTAFDMNTGKKTELPGKTSIPVEMTPKGISIGETVFSVMVRLKPTEGKAVSVEGRKYRDSIVLKKNGDKKITVINELGLESYLYGILPLEVSAEWPKESLKAQAVVSRTFALKNLQRHQSEGYNLCNKVHCQVFGGLGVEKESTNKAVDSTKNEVIEYNGELVNSVFFSNCGGKTENTTDAWDTTFQPPYIKIVRCKYCKKNKHYRWERTLSQDIICETLQKSGYKVTSPVRSISIHERGKSGRAKFLKIKSASGAQIIRASHFRMSLGPDSIRSTLLTKIKKTKDGYHFEGKGWGHGVGMCQEGSKGMADKGKSYEKIIRFYYPGTKVVRLQD